MQWTQEQTFRLACAVLTPRDFEVFYAGVESFWKEVKEVVEFPPGLVEKLRNLKAYLSSLLSMIDNLIYVFDLNISRRFHGLLFENGFFHQGVFDSKKVKLSTNSSLRRPFEANQAKP